MSFAIVNPVPPAPASDELVAAAAAKRELRSRTDAVLSDIIATLAVAIATAVATVLLFDVWLSASAAPAPTRPVEFWSLAFPLTAYVALRMGQGAMKLLRPNFTRVPF